MSEIVLGWLFGRADDERRSGRQEHRREATELVDQRWNKVADSTTEVDSDIAIVRRLCHGDESALNALVTLYYEPLVRFAAQMVHSVDVAEDVVQGMFCWLWEHRTSWQPTHVKPYLYTATRRRVLNLLDQDAVRHRLGTLAVQHAARAVTPDSESDSTDLVTDLVAQLPEPQRTATRLRYQDGMTFAEIAEVLQTTPAGAERMIQRAVARLRTQYRDWERGPEL